MRVRVPALRCRARHGPGSSPSGCEGVSVPPGASDGTIFLRIHASMVGWMHIWLVHACVCWLDFMVAMDIMVCLDDMAGMDLLDLLVIMEFMDTGAAYNLRTFSLREHVY